jgi:zinc transport system ATP-binding protein
MTQNLIEVRGLDLAYEGQTILRDVSTDIAAGEIVTIVGPNGSGKSSLLKALLGAMPPARGRIDRIPGLRIGYVPQRLVLDPALPMTVRRFLSLPHRKSGQKVAEALDAAGADALGDRQMRDLSGGQAQRVLLARALLDDPQLVLLDEPTQGLDQPGAAAFYQRIADLRQARGCAVVMVSHDLHVVMAASDRVLCINGHVCCQGTPDVVASAPEYRALFGTGTGGALALYRHEHHHHHDEPGGPAGC